MFIQLVAENPPNYNLLSKGHAAEKNVVGHEFSSLLKAGPNKNKVPEHFTATTRRQRTGQGKTSNGDRDSGSAGW